MGCLVVVVGKLLSLTVGFFYMQWLLLLPQSLYLHWLSSVPLT